MFKSLFKCPLPKCRIILTLLSVIGILLVVRYRSVLNLGGFNGHEELNVDTQVYLSRPGGQGFLDKMLTGRWVPRNYTTQELAELEKFNKRVWNYYKIPLTLQSEDNKCGSMSFRGLAWFRSLCNPKGSTPCCMNNNCVNKSVQECQCPECYDMRQQIHGELATWKPNDPSVMLTQFTSEKDVCRVLGKKTVYFIGDSFMRQLYTSVLAMLRENRPRHVIRDDVPLDTVEKCDKYYRFVADCRGNLILDSLECNGTATLSMKNVYLVKDSSDAFKSAQVLKGKVNSWLVVGLGGHDFYDMMVVRKSLIDPLLKILENSTWPKLIWMAAQAPGLLKTGSEKRQQTPALMDYNEKLKSILGHKGIPIMNFFQITRGLFSYDGSHYGKGVNDVKANILLNFLQQESST